MDIVPDNNNNNDNKSPSSTSTNNKRPHNNNNNTDHSVDNHHHTATTTTTNSNNKNNTTTTMRKSITYGHQKDLPKLPIPDLASTLDKFIKTVAPLLTPEQLLQTQILAKDYLDTRGPVEYEALKQYALSRNSYVEEFWDDAYLCYDAPTVINVCPIFVLEDDPTPSRSQVQARAVSLIYSSLKFVRAVRLEILHPDKAKDSPLCMSQYKRLFGSARVPDPSNPFAPRDTVVTSNTSTHIVVLCRSQFYWFECLFPDEKCATELAVTERELHKNLEMIIQDATLPGSEESNTKSVGVLTTENRARWRKTRHHLSELSMNNKRVLHVIDSALFMVCLDVDYQPESVALTAANLLHGSYSHETHVNRWYDKLQLIVMKGGGAGVNFEHSACDGHTVLRFASDVFTDTVIRFAQTISSGISSHLMAASSSSHAISSLHHTGSGNTNTTNTSANKMARPIRPDVKPRKLEFDLDVSLLQSIRFARSRLGDLILQNDTAVMEFEGFGKTFLVQNSLSPDATVQLAIQYAFFNLYGEVANVYESVLTKSYYHGRTEAGRSCTPEAVKLLKLYCLDDDAISTVEDRIAALREATKAHTKMTSECAKGQGVDRLLYALECFYKKYGSGSTNNKIHPLFEDIGYKRLSESVLSTSNCGNPSLRFFGFGPVCPSGFGIGYIIKDDAIHLMITSKHRQTERFRDGVAKFLERVHDDLMESSPSQEPVSTSLRISRLDSVKNFQDMNEINSDDGDDEDDPPMYDFFGVSMSRVGRALSVRGSELGGGDNKQ
jgi:carnitine O-acetyltransferase